MRKTIAPLYFLDMDIQPSCTENDKIVSLGLLDLKNKDKKKGNYIPFFLLFLSNENLYSTFKV
jgi:hypothetical protein